MYKPFAKWKLFEFWTKPLHAISILWCQLMIVWICISLAMLRAYSKLIWYIETMLSTSRVWSQRFSSKCFSHTFLFIKPTFFMCRNKNETTLHFPTFLFIIITIPFIRCRTWVTCMVWRWLCFRSRYWKGKLCCVCYTSGWVIVEYVHLVHIAIADKVWNKSD